MLNPVGPIKSTKARYRLRKLPIKQLTCKTDAGDLIALQIEDLCQKIFERNLGYIELGRVK